MHIRRKLLIAVRDQLKAADQFSTVKIQRALPKRAAYPAITLYAESENVDTLQVGSPPRDQERNLRLSIVAWIRGTPDDERSEEKMDEAAEAIELAIVAPADAEDIQLIDTDFQVDEEEPDIHAVILTYNINYFSTENNPTI